jgi:uncharacterized protein YndB with AHSA1/START domain
MKPIQQTYLINASPAQVWRALTDPKIIEAWSGADAKFEPTVGADYALWDKSICGKVIAVTPRKQLAQTWQPADWQRTDSVVTFTLTPVGNKTRVDLLHENVEEFDYDGTTEGWDVYYLGAIKRMFAARVPKKQAVVKKKVTRKKQVTTKKSVKKTTKK